MWYCQLVSYVGIVSTCSFSIVTNAATANNVMISIVNSACYQIRKKNLKNQHFSEPLNVNIERSRSTAMRQATIHRKVLKVINV